MFFVVVALRDFNMPVCTEAMKEYDKFIWPQDLCLFKEAFEQSTDKIIGKCYSETIENNREEKQGNVLVRYKYLLSM